MLSHFKGHGMGGFGGAMKNTSIGLGSSYGKKYIHQKMIQKQLKNILIYILLYIVKV